MGSKLKRFIDNYWVLFIFLAIKLILQYILVNPVYELHRDEFLHLDQANHLAFGFISVPPFTSLISKLIYLLGGSIFWVRFFPAIFGALTVLVVWLTVEAIGGKLWARILVSSALVFSPLVRLNILFQPNSFDVLAWTLIFYLAILFVQSEKPKWIFVLSVVASIGLYNKYNVIFLLVGLLAGFMLTGQRKIFLNKNIWKAFAIIFLLLLPNIAWQVVHHFPVLYHMQVLKETQLDNNSSIGFLKGQLFFFLGSLPLSICALIAFQFYKPFGPFRFIGISFIVVLVLYSILKAKDYYAIGLYPVLFVFGGVYLEKVMTKKWKSILFPVLIGINLGLFVLTAKLIYPVLSPPEIAQNNAAFEKIGMLRWEDGKNHTLPQDFADMIGWQEMANKALTAYKLIPDNERDKTLIFCDNYGQTGALNYYNRQKMPEAYSFNTDYIYWLPHLNKIQNILLVGEKPNKKITDMFMDCRSVGMVENEYAREKGTEIYLLTGANEEVTKMFYKMAEDRKTKHDIF